jgi:hypothetical protein
MLNSVLNGWEPDDLIERFGQDSVDEIAYEVGRIAAELRERVGGS